MAESNSRSPLEEVEAQTTHRYSIVRAVRRAIELGERHGFHPDGLEGEVSREIAHRIGEVLARVLDASRGAERYDRHGSRGRGYGLASRMFIDVLRAKLVVEALGGQITSSSTEKGSVQLPVQTAGTPVTWVAEGSNAGANTGLTVSSVTFVPAHGALQYGRVAVHEGHLGPGLRRVALRGPRKAGRRGR